MTPAYESRPAHRDFVLANRANHHIPSNVSFLNSQAAPAAPAPPADDDDDEEDLFGDDEEEESETSKPKEKTRAEQMAEAKAAKDALKKVDR